MEKPDKKTILMKFNLIICLLLSAFMQVNAEIYAQKVTLNAQDVSMEDVFEAIKKQTGYVFFYNSEQLKDIRVDVQVTNSSVKETLEKCLKDLPFSYKIIENNIVIKSEGKMAKTSRRGSSQENIVVNGVIRDTDGNSLPGATVHVKNDRLKSVTTNVEGYFSIQVVEGSTLVISFIGFEPQEVIAKRDAQFNIVLKESESELDEVVVVGYRTQRKETLTGAVSTIDMSSKETETITHASQALYGTTGVWLNQAGSKPGSDGAVIRIRGVNTLSGNNPLVLLDGVEYSMSEIDPADIETITVLKDASAAIYGSKSSNGVILLTSKKGKAGKPRIEYRSHVGLQNATYLPDVVDDPILYMQMRNRAEFNSGKLTGTYSQEQIDEYRAGMSIDPSVYPASNWFDITMKQGMVQQHNARVSGGSENITYSIGLGYMDQQGILITNDDAQRYSFNMKLSADVTPRLKVSAGLTGNVRTYDEVGYGTSTVMGVIMRGLPIMSDYHRNNVYGSTWLYTPGRNNIENPRMETEQGFTKRDYQEFLSSLTLDYKLPFDIKYNGVFGYRKIDHWSKDFIPLMYTVNPKTGDQKVFNSTATSPRVKDWDAYNKQYSISHRLVWEKLFSDKHLAHVMFGQDYQVNDNRNFQAYNAGFYDNSLQELNALKDQTNAQATGGSSLDKLASFYSRLAYTFDDKYLFESTFRVDGSSRFAPGNEWGFFPSVSAGWLISEEDFFESNQINLLKVRGSVGKLGNQAVSIGSYNSEVVINTGYNYSFGGTQTGGAAVSALNYRDIKWESTLSYNIGIDLQAFNNKLSVTGDYFYKRTFDILRSVGIPSQVGGLTGPTLNLGTVDNKGYEFGVNYRDQIGAFDYGVNASLTYVKNEVVDIKGEERISGRYIIKEGYPINSYYLYESLGYYQSQDEIRDAQAVYGTRTKIRPGYIKYANQNDDAYIDDQDRIITGSTIPAYTFGFGANVGYKNFIVEAQFQGVSDVDVYPTGNVAFPFNNGAGVTYEWARDSWSETNPNSAYPLLTTYTDGGENFINSTHWLQDASYIRMKNIQLGYVFPASIANKMNIDRLMIYVSGQNLLTISKFKLWDPEMTVTRGDLYEYPNLKTFSFGLNVSF